MDFRFFKNCHPVKQIFRAMNLGEYLQAAQSWDQLRRVVNGRYVDAARSCAGKCSSGERVLLHAILYATDFAWLAGELDDGRAWRRLGYVSGSHRKAVIACLQT